MKRFNLTGVCVPDKHYMVDLSEKMDLIVRDYIEQGAYFTINRARQFGKATILSALARRLANDYLVIRLSFEGIDDDNFRDSTSFPNMFVKNVTKRLQQMNVRQDLTETWISTYYDTSVVTDKAFDILGDKITRLCSNADKGVILLVDEVDKSSDNQIFLNFLGMLRNKYLDMQEGLDTSFHNVILAGVYNVKNLQLKLRPEEERRYDSPWNIAAGKMREQHAFDYENNQFVENGELDMEQALRKFQEVMKAEFRSEDTHFLERQGRLLFLCFMKPIINGRGNYYVEPETRDNTRMDVVISYGGREYIVELKIWRGEQYRQKGLDMKYRYNYFCAITRDKIMAMIFVKNSMTSVGSAAIS